MARSPANNYIYLLNNIKSNLPNNITTNDINRVVRNMRPRLVNKIYNKLLNSPNYSRSRMMNTYMKKGLMNKSDINMINKKLLALPSTSKSSSRNKRPL